MITVTSRAVVHYVLKMSCFNACGLILSHLNACGLTLSLLQCYILKFKNLLRLMLDCDESTGSKTVRTSVNQLTDMTFLACRFTQRTEVQYKSRKSSVKQYMFEPLFEDDMVRMR